MPELSIIIPTYNSEKFIFSVIESIKVQTFSNYEIIIVDGLSTDSTLNTLETIVHSNLIIVSEKDKGIYDAMNKGICLAKGEWIYFLGSDDVLFDNQVMERVFLQHKSIIENSDIVYGNVLWGDSATLYKGRFSLIELYEENICHQAIFYRKSVFEKHGFYSLEFPKYADYFFNIKCFSDLDLKIKYIETIIAKYSLDGFSSKDYNRDTFLIEKKKLFTEIIKHQLPLTRLIFNVRFPDLMTFHGKLNFIKHLFKYSFLLIYDSIKDKKLKIIKVK